MFMSVDLPAPFSPTTACTSPGSTDRCTAWLATTPGNRLSIPRSSMTGAGSSTAGLGRRLRAPSGRRSRPRRIRRANASISVRDPVDEAAGGRVAHAAAARGRRRRCRPSPCRRRRSCTNVVGAHVGLLEHRGQDRVTDGGSEVRYWSASTPIAHAAPLLRGPDDAHPRAAGRREHHVGPRVEHARARPPCPSPGR